MTAHAWRPSVRKRQPVLRCDNAGCPIVWWPDRLEPKSQCTGAPVDAAAVVRALIVGGGT